MKKIIITIILTGTLLLVYVFLSKNTLITEKYNNPENISLGTFKELSPSIDGYSCFIFNNKEEMKNIDYLGAGDNSYQFFLSINETMVEFSKKQDRLVSTDNKFILDLVMNPSEIKNDQEYYEISGNLNLKNIDNNQEFKKDFTGFCSW